MSPLTESTRLTLAKGQPVPNDPSFAFNSLLLHGNGTNGSTVITDSSGSPKTVTAVGNAQISTAQSKFGGSSMLFDGAGDWLTCPMSTGFNFGTTDLTIEGWINVPVTDSTYRCILSIGAPVQIYNFNGNIVGFFGNSEGGGLFINPVNGPTSSLTANTWTHFAITRSGSTFKSFVNGVSGTAVTGTDAVFATLISTPAIGIYLPTSSLPFTGYIDDLRITKGVARYTANFTPPTAPFPDF